MVEGLARVISILLQMLQLMVITSALISMLSADPHNPIVKFIRDCTEPLYRPIRPFTNKIPGPFDWAPFVVILILVFIHSVFLHYVRQFF